MTELEFYNELAKELVPKGYRCFLYKDNYTVWLYVITPNNSWLYIDNADFGCGYNINYEYVPSKEFGSGCRYNSEPLYEITEETLLKAEEYGKNYCQVGYKKCPCCGGRIKETKRPAHYEDAMKALESSWTFDDLIEI